MQTISPNRSAFLSVSRPKRYTRLFTGKRPESAKELADFVSAKSIADIWQIIVRSPPLQQFIDHKQSTPNKPLDMAPISVETGISRESIRRRSVTQDGSYIYSTWRHRAPLDGPHY